MGSLHDAYELGGVAGHGRTTLVRLGVRRGDCSPVALKQLRLEHARDPERRGRFVQQARRACMLHHEHIEAVLDVVEGRDGPVAVAEWIDGRSLQRLALARRRKDEPWPVQEVALVARCLLEALRHAHHQPTAFDTQGMLHGGLWPGNVLVDVDGHVKIVDFGMASVWQEGREPWQDLEAMRYLSAEHVRHGATASSDLYAVGAIVHELLTGRRFRDECETEADMRAMMDRPAPPERARDDTPPALERLRRRLLDPVPNPRLTLEQVLDVCATLPLGQAREGLGALVQETLRTDSSASDPDPEPTPPRGIPLAAMAEAEAREQMAKARSQSSAAVHLAAPDGGLGIKLEQVPLGQALRPRRRDLTQSVPIPVDHERTAARAPRFLQQTAPPRGEQARTAERERSGSDEETTPEQAPAAEHERSDEVPTSEQAPAAEHERSDEVPTSEQAPAAEHEHSGSDEVPTPPEEVPEVDTAPLPLDETSADDAAADDAAVPEPIPEEDDDPGLLLEPDTTDVTAEVIVVPRLPEDERPDLAPGVADEPRAARDPLSPVLRWLRGPVGWALLGAAAVGIGVPLLSRCGSAEPEAPSAPPSVTRSR